MVEPADAASGFKQTTGADNAISITDNITTHTPCKAVYIGSGDSYAFHVGGAWITFLGAVVGSVIPVRATGARHNTGSTAPDANDIVFLY